MQVLSIVAVSFSVVAYQQDLARLVRSGFKPSVKQDVKSDLLTVGHRL